MGVILEEFFLQKKKKMPYRNLTEPILSARDNTTSVLYFSNADMHEGLSGLLLRGNMPADTVNTPLYSQKAIQKYMISSTLLH